MKILVIQQKMIGDVLTSSILFESLRIKYPNSKLDYLVNSNTLLKTIRISIILFHLLKMKRTVNVPY